MSEGLIPVELAEEACERLQNAFTEAIRDNVEDEELQGRIIHSAGLNLLAQLLDLYG